MNITMSPQQPMLSVTKAIPFQSGIFADVWRVTQERYYQVKKVCRSALINPALICARLTIALGLATAVFPVDAEYYFNPRFLSNDLAESVDLSAFTKGREAPPGTYRVDIYLNDEFMTSRDITFIADDNNAELIPCLSTDLLVSLGIKKSALLDNKEHSAEKHVPDNSACTPLQDRLADASTEFDVGQQHLSLSVPQIYVGRMARGYVSPDLWEEGINAGLLNYSFNGNSINNRRNK